MSSIAVIGAGPMGLSTALELLKQGHSVDLYEADSRVGGMTASFDFDGTRIERFYHFICTGDAPYLNSLRELNIEDKLHWVNTSMGYFHQSEIKEWGNPLALLKFKGLGIVAKIRYGLHVFLSMKRKNWRKLEPRDAVSWLKSWVGEETYRELWRPLFDLKFYHYTDNLSAAWIWARMRRLGTSRSSLMTEKLGYLEGGSDTWLEAMVNEIKRLGGHIHLSCRVDEILSADNTVQGVRCGDRKIPHHAAISTVPLPFVSQMIPSLPATTRRAYEAINNIAVVCVLVKLKRSFSPHFWLNVSDERISIPGLIEYSNLNPMEASIVYVPFYLPGDHPDYQREDAWFTERTRDYLRKIRPDFNAEDILTIRAGRYRYAQPICPPDFLDSLPPIETPVSRLLVADTSYYYPEDRSISESVKLGTTLAQLLTNNLERDNSPGPKPVS